MKTYQSLNPHGFTLEFTGTQFSLNKNETVLLTKPVKTHRVFSVMADKVEARNWAAGILTAGELSYASAILYRNDDIGWGVDLYPCTGAQYTAWLIFTKTGVFGDGFIMDFDASGDLMMSSVDDKYSLTVAQFNLNAYDLREIGSLGD